MVNWKRVQRAKKLGGLGIPELGNFNRALRLRWQWLKWKDNNKPWSDMQIHYTPTEAELFRACTSITLDNGQRTSFWHDRWLQGHILKELAPELFRLAWRKNEKASVVLMDGNWKRGLRRLATTTEINQYV